MNKEIMIGNHKISEDSPTFVIAEMSANHLMDFDRAVAIMQAAKDAGADAIKIQTYTPDTITLDCDDPCFQITQGTIWDGTTLHKLYETAYTPWEWQPKLKKIAEEMGLVFFSSPFDLTSIDFLEEMEVPVYKVASFEINDIPFIRKIARTGKPIIMSTGIAYLADIELALRTCKEEGNENVILLKCTSAYPAPYEDINLKTIPSMKEVFDCVVGLSDHTMGCAVAGAGVALGAKVVEKHLTLRRADGGADAAFSMEPEEFKEMVDHIRMIEKAVGKVTYDLTPKQKKSREHSRSLFVAQDMKAGDVFTPENLRSVRPSCGLHTRYYEELLGKRITRDGNPYGLVSCGFHREGTAVRSGNVLFSCGRQCCYGGRASDALPHGGTGITKKNRASGRTLLFVRGAGICGTVAELEHAGENPWDGSCRPGRRAFGAGRTDPWKRACFSGGQLCGDGCLFAGIAPVWQGVSAG